MALFSLQKIDALAVNHPTYLRGISLYNGGFIRRIERRQGGMYAEILTADIDTEDRRGTVACEVCFDYEGNIAQMSCSCPVFEPRNGACKHLVAALAHKYYTDMVRGVQQAPVVRAAVPTRTDSIAASMISRYMDAQTAKLTARSGEDAPVHLTPRLHIHGRTCTLALSVGTARDYVVQDLRAFCEAVEEHRSVSYGKDLTFYHHPDRFAAEDRPLLRFLTGQLPPAVRGAGSHALRELSLSPVALDVFLSLMRSRSLACRAGQINTVAEVRREDPTLTVTVTKTENGFTLSMPTTPLTLTGNRRRYVLANGVLHACSTRFSEAAGGLLDALQAAHGQLFIANDDMPALCAGVIKAAKDVVILSGDTDALAAFTPAALEAELYLDAPDKQTIAAKLLFCYGERRVNAFSDDPLDGVNRDSLAEYRLRLLAEGWFDRPAAQDGRLFLHGDNDRLFRFITAGIAAWQQEAAVYATDRVREVGLAVPPRVTVGVRLHSDLLDLSFAADGIDADELRALLASYRERRPYHRLKNGGFLSLADPALQGLYALTEGLSVDSAAVTTGHVALPAYRALYLDRVLRDHPAIRLQRDEGFRRLVRDINTVADNAFSPPASLDGVLRNYQKTGFRWLKTLKQYGFGGILADDMGLGKTVQMISLLLDAKEEGETRPSLVVCPASLVYNWVQECARFAPSLCVKAITGDKDTRTALLADLDGVDTVITSYDLLRRDIEQYAALDFAVHVLDEAQYIKNADTQIAHAVKAIRSQHRFVLTGTPVENRLSELWSIFDFLMPDFLYSYPRFRERLERPIVQDGDKLALERLTALVSPFVMRRLKADVLRELPEKREAIVRVPLCDTQRELYAANVRRLREELHENGLSRNHITVLAMLTRLRQICCSPALVYEDYDAADAKTEACIDLLREAVSGGHKVLLFSQFTAMIDRLQTRLKQENIAYYDLRGSTPKEQRLKLTEAFNTDDTPVFLISLKAGGTGLNLTGADTVIHFDPWWNMSAQNQATDRAHRIGQTRTVQVYKLIAADTVEEKILAMQEQKQALADAVVREGDGILSKMTADELIALLEE